MAHTFDIRFVRTGGLAGLFEAPANAFGWRGSGLLSIDPLGMHIEVKRGLMSLLTRQRSQRIPAGNIREVFRAGEALRVEFANDKDTRAVIPFWAPDRETAAQIVELLPTTRTIELEDETPAARGGSGSKKLQLLISLFAVIACGALFFGFRESKTTASSQVQPPSAIAAEVTADESPTLELPPEIGLHPERAPESPPPATPAEAAAPIVSDTPEAPPPKPSVPRKTPRVGTPTPAANTQDEENFVPTIPEIRVRPADVVVPIRQGTLAYDKARSLLRNFEEGASELTADYRRQREIYDDGRLSQNEFVDKLNSAAGHWRDLGSRLLNTRDAVDPALTGLRAALLLVVTYQDSFLTGYATAVRNRDSAATDKAFEDLAQAEELLASARRFIQ